MNKKVEEGHRVWGEGCERKSEKKRGRWLELLALKKGIAVGGFGGI